MLVPEPSGTIFPSNVVRCTPATLQGCRTRPLLKPGMDLDALFSQWFPAEAKAEQDKEDEGKGVGEGLAGFERIPSDKSKKSTASQRAAWEPKYDEEMKMVQHI